MLLSEIFEYLNYGELSQIHMGDSRANGISETSYPALISFLNLAMIELYKRFPLKMDYVSIQLYPNKYEYKLESIYSVNTGVVSNDTPILYLLDTVEKPFNNRILKIENVTTSDKNITGNMPLNDLNNPSSLKISSFNTLTVPEHNGTDILTVHYRAAPDRINPQNIIPESTEIPIPDTLIEPLIFYMAHRAHGSIAAIDGNTSEAIMYLQKFEASVLQIKKDGLIENYNTTNTNLTDNGWI